MNSICINCVRKKIHNRYAEVTEEIQQRLDYELSIINRMGYDSYFLIVMGFYKFCSQSKYSGRAWSWFGSW